MKTLLLSAALIAIAAPAAAQDFTNMAGHRRDADAAFQRRLETAVRPGERARPARVRDTARSTPPSATTVIASQTECPETARLNAAATRQGGV